MFWIWRRSAALLAVMFWSIAVHAAEHPVSVCDCVSIRRVTEGPKLSADGKKMAYVVKFPNTQTNENIYELRVRDLHEIEHRTNGRLLLTSKQSISGLHWLRDGRRVAVLVGKDGTLREPSTVVVVNVAEGDVRTAAELKHEDGIVDYSISDDGSTVVYSAPVPPPLGAARSSRFADRGFPIQESYPAEVQRRKGAVRVGPVSLWIAHRDEQTRTWETKRIHPPEDALSPDSEPDTLRYADFLSVSPNGEFVAFLYGMLTPSKEIQNNRVSVAYFESYAAMPDGIAVYDIKNHDYLKNDPMLFAHPPIYWSADSSSYSVAAIAPLGSKWEKSDTRPDIAPISADIRHQFAIDVKTGAVSEVLRASDLKKDASVVAWKDGASGFIVQYGQGDNSIAEFTRSGDEWKETSRITTASASFAYGHSGTLDGVHFVGVQEDPKHPPEIWYADISGPQKKVQLTDLNPTVAEYELGDLRDLSWINKYGYQLHGKLLTPSHYVPAKRYPLVILLTWPRDGFLCDTEYTTAFAPQPLASAGFIVAIFNIYNAFNAGGAQPQGPPYIKEVESMDASVEALIDVLDKQGLIRRDDVGLAGFSRSSGKVDYFLTHSAFKLRAASSADGGVGNYGGLWIYDGGEIGRAEAKSHGGPFVGKARSAWLESAPAFNVDKVNAPVLMEYTGAEGLDDWPEHAYEFHAGLMSLGKAVDLFYYPNGAHPLDTPFERVASLQRNVDWFRFWMQGYQGKAPDYDPDQYKRWENLRELLKADLASATAGAAAHTDTHQ